MPVLALNGEVDPQDPPSNMADAAAVWPNSLAVAVPGQGHDLDPSSAQCVVPLVQAFIDQGTIDGLDTTCMTQLQRPEVDLTLPNN